MDWFGNATYATTAPIGDKHLTAMDCPSHPFNDEQLDNGTGMEHLARGNYAACYGKGGYGTRPDQRPDHRRHVRQQLQGPDHRDHGRHVEHAGARAS